MQPVLQPRLRLRLPAIRASIETARIAVLDFLSPGRPTARTVFDVELILEEVLMNIAFHGRPRGDADTVDRQVEITVESTPTEVRMTFEDDGVAFDPTTAPLPKRPATLADAVPGGLGVGLVRMRARSLAYARRNGRNVTTVAIARD